MTWQSWGRKCGHLPISHNGVLGCFLSSSLSLQQGNPRPVGRQSWSPWSPWLVWALLCQAGQGAQSVGSSGPATLLNLTLCCSGGLWLVGSGPGALWGLCCRLKVKAAFLGLPGLPVHVSIALLLQHQD